MTTPTAFGVVFGIGHGTSLGVSFLHRLYISLHKYILSTVYTATVSVVRKRKDLNQLDKVCICVDECLW
jgi:hypothetical protein